MTPARKSVRSTAAVVTVGTELTSGLRYDTNGPEIAARLESLGITVALIASVPDDADRISHVIATAIAECDLVIVTGGLGPTHDDVTREAAARAVGRPLERSSDVVAQLQRLATRHAEPESRTSMLRQADVIEGARVLPATVGTAPGQLLDLGDTRIALLPGPPHEMRPMLDQILADRSPSAPAHIIRTVGCTESDVQVRVQRILGATAGIRFTILASPGLVDVVLADGGSGSQALQDHADRVVTELGDIVYGRGAETLAKIVLARARVAHLRLATAESCTGGLVAAALTSVPGSSDVFRGAVVGYANAVKTALLDVPPGEIDVHGAVSKRTAEAMAAGARARVGADVAVSTTGIAGPAGGSNDKPVGTVFVGIATSAGTDARKFHFIGDRDAVRLRATYAALDMLRRAIGHHHATGDGEGCVPS